MDRNPGRATAIHPLKVITSFPWLRPLLSPWPVAPEFLFQPPALESIGPGQITTVAGIGRYFAEMVSGVVCYIGYIIAGFDGFDEGAEGELEIEQGRAGIVGDVIEAEVVF